MVNGSGETIFSSSFILTEVKPTAPSTQLLFEGAGKKEKRIKCNPSPAQSKCLFCRPWKLIAISVKRAYRVGATFRTQSVLAKESSTKCTPGGLNPSGRLIALCHLVCSRMGGSSMPQSVIRKGRIHHLKTSLHLDCEKRAMRLELSLRPRSGTCPTAQPGVSPMASHQSFHVPHNSKHTHTQTPTESRK